jgi:hypothetical protein
MILTHTYLAAVYHSLDGKNVFDVPIVKVDGSPRLLLPNGHLLPITESLEFGDTGTIRLVEYGPRPKIQIDGRLLPGMVRDLNLPAIPQVPAPIAAPVSAPEQPKARNLQEAKILNEQAALARLTARQNQSRQIMENTTANPRQQALNNMAAADLEKLNQSVRDRNKARGR